MSARNASHGTQVERAADNVLLITRVFRARPETVFDAMTQPELMKRWWAPTSLGVIIHSIEADLRVGGAYRQVFGKVGEPPMAFSGVYKEFDRPNRLVYTTIFEPMRAAGEGLITITYEAHPEGTLYTQREEFPSKQVLDGVIASGMEKGMRETLDTLAALVPTL